MRNADMPAMPMKNPEYDGNWDNRRELGGLTKREHFAAMAMQGLASEIAHTVPDAQLASYAASLADALLAELEKTNA